MITKPFRCIAIGALLGAGVLQPDSGFAQVTNTVGVSGFAYTFQGSQTANPTITLFRGVTYVFSLNAVGHPFFIKSNFSDGTANAYNNGVINNGAQSGFITFAVPQDAPNQLFYNCSTHSSIFQMRGTFNIQNSPVPPSGEIVLVELSPTGVTMKSLGAANWQAIPEYSSNLVNGSWAPVPNFTSVLANGTNTITFDRLEPICGPNVFLRVKNQSQ